MTAHRAMYTVEALKAEGFTVSSLRYYRRIGLLPPAYGRGPGARYGDEHIIILRKVKHSRDQHRSLAEIAEETAHLTRHAGARA